MTKDEALDLALEALESFAPHNGVFWRNLHKEDAEIANAITAIKQARSAPVQKRPQNCGTGYCSCVECVMEPAPVQEPVAYMFEFPDKRLAPKFDSAPHGGNWQPLYTTPPAAQVQEPVSLEQEREAFEAWHDSFFVNKGHAAHHRFYDRDGYCIDEIQNQWKGWKERAKRTTPPAAPVQEK